MKHLVCALLLALMAALPAMSETIYAVDAIHVSGNGRTKTRVITRELTFNRNDLLTARELSERIEESEIQLKNLDIFSSVQISYSVENRSGLSADERVPVEIRILVKEKWTLFPFPNFDYNTVEGITAGVQVSDSNFLGLHQQLIGAFSYNPNDIMAKITFGDPRVGGSKLHAGLSATYRDFLDTRFAHNTELVYSARVDQLSLYAIVGYDFQLSVPIFGYGDLNLYDRSSTVTLDKLGDVRDSFSLLIGPGVDIGKVNKDNGMRSGQLLRLWIAVNPIEPFTPEAVDYSWIVGFRQFIPYSRSSYFSYRIKTWFDTNSRSLSINDLRGIQYGEVAGKLGFLTNVELVQRLFTLRWPTTIDVYLPLFLDMGLAADRARDLSLSSVTPCPGLAIKLYPRRLGMFLQVSVAFNLQNIMQQGTVKLGKGLQISLVTEDMF